jgi:hypothetical protein
MCQMNPRKILQKSLSKNVLNEPLEVSLKNLYQNISNQHLKISQKSLSINVLNRSLRNFSKVSINKCTKQIIKKFLRDFYQKMYQTSP